MKVLILGGTRFVGRATVDACLARGHDVTLFNRGVTNPGLFPEVEHLRGDRLTNVDALRERAWDVVFDIAAYDPAAVASTTSVLHATVGRYVFVSTLSVYADHSRPHGEDWPLLELNDATPEADLYGARKARAESIVREAYGNRSLIVRAGMITGPFDPTDRLSYWPRRLAGGGRYLAPGQPSDPLQFIDVRDLAGWMVNSALRGLEGTFNVTGEVTCFDLLLDACQSVADTPAQRVWVSSRRLLDAGVDPWMGVPLWIAADGWEGANRVDIARARHAGLTFRPMEETVRDVWIWDQERRKAGFETIGLTAEREAELLGLV